MPALLLRCATRYRALYICILGAVLALATTTGAPSLPCSCPTVCDATGPRCTNYADTTTASQEGYSISGMLSIGNGHDSTTHIYVVCWCYMPIPPLGP